MPRNIKRTLPGLNVVSFSGSSPSPVRRRLELATADMDMDECSTRLLVQGSEGIEEEINLVNELSTPTSFEFHTKELSENENDSAGVMRMKSHKLVRMTIENKTQPKTG